MVHHNKNNQVKIEKLELYKKSFLLAPKPHNSTPLTYKNNGITVIGPAKKINNIMGGSENLKSLCH